MKIPVVTITLVAAALVYVVWDRTSGPEPTGSARFSDLAANPASRAEVLDSVIAGIADVCEDATGTKEGAEFEACVEQADVRSSSCRRAMADQFPDNVTSEAVFRDLSITMMNCLVPVSGRVQP